MTEPIYIVDGARTPFLKARNRPGPFAASDLATDAGRALLVRQRFDPPQLDEVILGPARRRRRTEGEHRPRLSRCGWAAGTRCPDGR